MSTVKEAVDIEVPVRTAYGRLARARPARESWFGHLATWDAKPRSRTGIPWAAVPGQDPQGCGERVRTDLALSFPYQRFSAGRPR